MYEDENILKMEVESTAIKSFEYNKKGKILRVNFMRGGYYDYADIEEELVREWMKEGENGSFGQYYNRKIR